MASSNSNVESYVPPSRAITVDRNNIIFVVHRRGFITCLCGKTLTKHTCNLQTHFKNIEIKFDFCPDKETCRFCEDTVQWDYERYINVDDKLFCRKCSKEITSDKGICHDCFCKICYAHLKDCVCCKFHPDVNAQCLCGEQESKET